MLVFPTMRRIVARASNRAFVGLPLCTHLATAPYTAYLGDVFNIGSCYVGRNEDFLGHAIGFTENLMKDAIPLRLVSPFVKP